MKLLRLLFIVTLFLAPDMSTPRLSHAAVQLELYGTFHSMGVIVNLTAGEPLLPGASIDLSVSATSIGFGTQPVELRVSANGRPVDTRRVTPSASDT